LQLFLKILNRWPASAIFGQPTSASPSATRVLPANSFHPPPEDQQPRFCPKGPESSRGAAAAADFNPNGALKQSRIILL